METTRTIWENSRSALQTEMTSISFNTWVKPIEPLCIKDNTLILLAQNEIAKKTLHDVYAQSVTNAVNEANGTSLLVRFIDASERGAYSDTALEGERGV